jgi:site-specific recombinase XerD
MEARSTLANATLQQHLTVVRLFHDFLVEERVCTRNPLRPLIGGRGLIQRHHRLPWIPSEEEWQNILQVCKPLRNRVMLAMSYDAALRREEICSRPKAPRKAKRTFLLCTVRTFLIRDGIAESPIDYCSLWHMIVAVFCTR